MLNEKLTVSHYLTVYHHSRFIGALFLFCPSSDFLISQPAIPTNIPQYRGIHFRKTMHGRIISMIDWNFTMLPQPGLHGFVLGGSTAINVMAYCRGSKDDYGRWAQVTDDEGWSWNSLQPYIHKIKNLSPSADNHSIIDEIDVSIHGSGGPVSFSLPGQLLPTDEHAINTSSKLSAEFPFNLDYSSGDTIGVGWTQAMVGPVLLHENNCWLNIVQIAKGQHVTSAAAYLIPAMSRPNLDIIANSQVTKILQTGTKDGQPVFSAIQFYTVGHSEIHTINASKEIIISAGAINTPQLWNQLAWLRLPNNATIFKNNSDPSASNRSAHYEFIVTDSFVSFSQPFLSAGKFNVFKFSGNISLNSTDPFAHPLIQPNMLQTEFDIFTMHEAIKAAHHFMGAKSWLDWIIEETSPSSEAQTDEEIEEYIKNTCFTVNHVTCIVPMGKNGQARRGDGALNPDLSVKGTVGLRVVDASAFPFIPAALVGHESDGVMYCTNKGVEMVRKGR
ncbi:hypothetical protein EV368DRAFT_75854 [Lentinula lateritia]|nr:hypothetical protein EV368DRAFT_75854 [Lentinula lateritia]